LRTLLVVALFECTLVAQNRSPMALS